MKSFNEYYTREKQLITPKYQYYYLKDGKSIGPFDQKPIIKNPIEKVWVNEKEYKEASKEVNDEYNNAIENWYKDLKNEWSELPDKVFDLCYSFAYDKYHSSGFDEVANGMYDICYFAKEIISANKG